MDVKEIGILVEAAINDAKWQKPAVNEVAEENIFENVPEPPPVINFNPYHGKDGKFTSKGGSGGSNEKGSVPKGKSSLDSLKSMKTGDSFSGTLYRGEGATDHRIPSQFGEGQYWSPHKDLAATYGPSVREKKISLKNAYVFDLPNKDPYYKELKKEFGTDKPDEITKLLKSKGHDGLIVRNVPAMRDNVAIQHSIEVISFSKK